MVISGEQDQQVKQVKTTHDGNLRWTRPTGKTGKNYSRWQSEVNKTNRLDFQRPAPEFWLNLHVYSTENKQQVQNVTAIHSRHVD